MTWSPIKTGLLFNDWSIILTGMEWIDADKTHIGLFYFIFCLKELI